jgi:hypothetical protein
LDGVPLYALSKKIVAADFLSEKSRAAILTHFPRLSANPAAGGFFVGKRRIRCNQKQANTVIPAKVFYFAGLCKGAG